MIRVAHVIDSLGAGGAERSLALLLPRLAHHGIESIVVALRDVPSTERQRIVPPASAITLQSAGLIETVVELRRRLIDLEPDLVHTTLFKADIAGRAAARGIAPTLTSLVNSPYGAQRRKDTNVPLWKLQGVRALDALTGHVMTRHFHAITRAVAVDAGRHLGIRSERITVIPRGRDAEALGRRTEQRRAAARLELGLAPGQPVLLNVGRREWQKGQSALIDAMAPLVGKFPDLVCIIAGREGNESAALRDHVRRHALEESVRFVGHRDDVAELMCAADVFVFPSRYEGLGGALIEAMALECPVVASDVPAIREVLDEGRCGRLVPVDDVDAMTQAITGVLAGADAVTCQVAAGRARFENCFEISAVAEATARLMRQVGRTD